MHNRWRIIDLNTFCCRGNCSDKTNFAKKLAIGDTLTRGRISDTFPGWYISTFLLWLVQFFRSSSLLHFSPPSFFRVHCFPLNRRKRARLLGAQRKFVPSALHQLSVKMSRKSFKTIQKMIFVAFALARCYKFVAHRARLFTERPKVDCNKLPSIKILTIRLWLPKWKENSFSPFGNFDLIRCDHTITSPACLSVLSGAKVRRFVEKV
jgi:hypothetical protein